MLLSSRVRSSVTLDTGQQTNIFQRRPTRIQTARRVHPSPCLAKPRWRFRHAKASERQPVHEPVLTTINELHHDEFCSPGKEDRLYRDDKLSQKSLGCWRCTAGKVESWKRRSKDRRLTGSSGEHDQQFARSPLLLADSFLPSQART